MQITTVRERLTEARRLRGVTQQEIADLLGVQQSAVSHWSTGRNDPSNDDLAKIAAHLNVRAAWLILGDGPMTADQAPAPPPPTTTKKRRPKSRASKPGVRRVSVAPPTTELRAAN